MDFAASSIHGASDPAGWAPQFRPDDGERLVHVPVGTDHFVLAKSNADLRELSP
jgi:hypothetical protein